jgi:periplasmic divalent cation tolerance protein
MSGILMVFCTFPDAVRARQVGKALVERQLAACVNLLPGVESIYGWEGILETSAETLAIFKTTAAAWPEFGKALAELHPYDVPEIVAVAPETVSAAYRDWVFGGVKPAG